MWQNGEPFAHSPHKRSEDGSGQPRDKGAGFQFCFLHKPDLTFDISLKGIVFSEVPGLVTELKRRLLNIIAAEAVEPSRVWVSLETPFHNLYTRKQAGPAGQFKVRPAYTMCSKLSALL
jgi:hypothetical protein